MRKLLPALFVFILASLSHAVINLNSFESSSTVRYVAYDSSYQYHFLGGDNQIDSGVGFHEFNQPTFTHPDFPGSITFHSSYETKVTVQQPSVVEGAMSSSASIEADNSSSSHVLFGNNVIYQRMSFSCEFESKVSFDLSNFSSTFGPAYSYQASVMNFNSSGVNLFSSGNLVGPSTLSFLVGPGTHFFYITHQLETGAGNFWFVNSPTGSAAFNSSIGFRIAETTPVPEPASMGALGLALCGMLKRGRKGKISDRS